MFTSSCAAATAALLYRVDVVPHSDVLIQVALHLGLVWTVWTMECGILATFKPHVPHQSLFPLVETTTLLALVWP